MFTDKGKDSVYRQGRGGKNRWILPRLHAAPMFDAQNEERMFVSSLQNLFRQVWLVLT